MNAVFGLLFLFVHCALSLDCDEGWVAFEESCYNISTTEDNWHHAQKHCEALESSLVSIESEAENTFIVQNVGETALSLWLGAMYDKEDDEWTWDSTWEAITFELWDDGEPDNNETESTPKHCLLMTKPAEGSYVWKAEDCSLAKRFICEKTEDDVLEVSAAKKKKKKSKKQRKPTTASTAKNPGKKRKSATMKPKKKSGKKSKKGKKRN